ncbi:peptidylprolyl isomerase [Gryllotalpicola sp.]|uniref:peptidylprolyl isomerase n=1 Tax=Gryllotalpicola sp. TaxID=1932787 RepID=UPI0026197744|nr:peptidylprolyl isomerase [Gryllotalpicola sp.]
MAKKTDREARVARERLRAYQARQGVHQARLRRRRRDNIAAGFGVIVAAIIAVGAQLGYFGAGPGAPEPVPSSSASNTPSPAASSASPSATGGNQGNVPAQTVAANRSWTGTLTLNKTIALGIELDGKAAPQAASAVISLIRSGWYDGTVCHRLTTSGIYVLQCGGGRTVATAGSGGPGYSYGPVENAPADNVYATGVIAMARQSDNGYSNGSQFFIVYQESTIPSDIVGGYTVVGKVTSGLSGLVTQVVDKGETDSNPSAPGDGTPKVATTITSVTIK